MDIVREYPLYLLSMAALLVLSAFFSGSETALFSLRREQLRRLEKRGTVLAAAILKLTDDSRGTLATVLLGNMIVNVLFFSISYVLSTHLAAQSHTMAMVFGAATFLLLLVFAEVAPKGIALRAPLGVANLVALPLLLCARALAPIRMPLSSFMRRSTYWFRPQAADEGYVSTDELKMLLDLSEKQGMIDPNASRMMQEVMELREIMLNDVMVPRVDVTAFDVNDSLGEFFTLVRSSHHKRIVVYDGSIDNVTGVVRARDVFLHPEKSLREHVRPVLFAPETKTIESMLRAFREQREKLAVVVDEYGGMAGLITLEDIVEEIVGDIADEFDLDQPPPVVRDGDAYLVAASLGTREWQNLFPIDLASPRFETLGGFFLSMLGRMPRKGDAVSYHGLRFTVVSMRGRRIDRLRVESLPHEEGDEHE